MKTFVIVLAALGAVPGLASPVTPTKVTENVPRGLEARVPRATTCGSKMYQASDISNAFSNAIALSGQGQTIAAAPNAQGRVRSYPTRFNNYDNINLPDCPGIAPPFIEFPVKRDGTPFQANDRQGLDRVVYKDNGNGQYQFCGVDTHEGQTGNRFAACT